MSISAMVKPIATKSNGVFNLEKPEQLQGIVQLLLEVQPQTIQAQIQTQEFIDDLDWINAKQNVEETYGLYRFQCCNKTGNYLNSWPVTQLVKSENIIGKEKTLHGLKARFNQYIDPSWIFTDADSLNQLSINDPIGYFCYSVNRLLPLQKEMQDTFNLERTKLQRFEDMINLNRLLQGYDETILRQANEIIRKFLGFINPKFQYTLLDTINPDISKIVPKLLIETINTQFKIIFTQEIKKGRLQANLTYDQVLQFCQRYKGFSNYRNQGKPKTLNDSDFAYLRLKESFAPELSQSKLMIKTMSGAEKVHSSFAKYATVARTDVKFSGKFNFGKKGTE